MLVMYSIMVTGLVYDSCLFMHSKQIFQGFHLSVHICLLSATNKTDGCCIFQGKDGAGLFVRLGVATGMKQLLKEHVVLAGLKASTEMSLCLSI